MIRIVASMVVLASVLALGAESAGMAGGERDGAKLGMTNSQYGRILADKEGFALYLFTRDRDEKSRCYGECAEAWPPFLTKGKPRVGHRLNEKLVGRTERRDGSKQVTYNGHPLYYYVGDNQPGQVLCQDVYEFGGTWLVVRKDGDPVQ